MLGLAHTFPDTVASGTAPVKRLPAPPEGLGVHRERQVDKGICHNLEGHGPLALLVPTALAAEGKAALFCSWIGVNGKNRILHERDMAFDDAP